MTRISSITRVGSFVAVALLAAACSGPQATIKSTGPTDTPENNWKQGMALLDKGDADGALASFQRAVGLDPKYAPGHTGVCLAQTSKGNFVAAEAAVKEALRWDGSSTDAYIAWGRLCAAQGKHPDAIAKYDRANEIKKTSDAWYWRGQSHEKLAKYDRAEADYGDAVKLDASHAKANDAWKNLQTARRVSVGGSPEYAKIAHADSVTRADVAAILCNELEVDKLLKKPAAGGDAQKFEAPKGPMDKPAATGAAPVASDISGVWAAAFVERCVGCGAMECYPDKTFKPTAKLNRAEFAMALQRLLVRVQNDPDLETKFVGQTSPFKDVSGTHFAFNSVMVVTTRGILKAKTDGTFGLADPVTGAEALEAIRAIKIAAK